MVSTVLVTSLSFAASREGEAVTARLNAATEHLRATDTLGQSSLRASLDNLAFECRRSGWDGYAAMPVEPASVEYAHRLLDAVPASRDIEVSVGAEADGQVTVEWHRSPSWTLSVSVSPTGELHYAAIFGSGSAYGTEPFDPSVGLPEAILRLIRRVEAA